MLPLTSRNGDNQHNGNDSHNNSNNNLHSRHKKASAAHMSLPKRTTKMAATLAHRYNNSVANTGKRPTHRASSSLKSLLPRRKVTIIQITIILGLSLFFVRNFISMSTMMKVDLTDVQKQQQWEQWKIQKQQPQLLQQREYQMQEAQQKRKLQKEKEQQQQMKQAEDAAAETRLRETAFELYSVLQCHDKLAKKARITDTDQPIPVQDFLDKRSPSRVPGYTVGVQQVNTERNVSSLRFGESLCRSQQPLAVRLGVHYGYVLRELASRILSRRIAHSSVLIVSPNMHAYQHPTTSSTIIATTAHQVGPSMACQAKRQGHQVYAVSGRQDDTVNSLWWAPNAKEAPHPSSVLFQQQQQQQSPPSPPPWLLLTVFDSPLGMEDEYITHHSSQLFTPLSQDKTNSNPPQRPPTMTYIVYSVSAILLPQNGTLEYNGIEATVLLQSLGYKVQVLSSSHATLDGPNKFGPNTLMKTREDVQMVLEYGLQVAKDAIFSRKSKVAVSREQPIVFHSWLFATQGLDLAIPSQVEHLVGKNIASTPEGTLDFKKGVPYKGCPVTSHASIQFTAVMEGQSSATNTSAPILLECFGQKLDAQSIAKAGNQSDGLWMNGPTVDESEAICVRCSKLRALDKSPPYPQTNSFINSRQETDVACTTRILDSNRASWNGGTKYREIAPEPHSDRSSKPNNNLLLIMVDPISRTRFQKSLPKTNRLIKQLGFLSFSNYTVVGDNSGPNQAALYSGALLTDRTTISSHNGDGSTQWIWDRLRGAGYATLKAEDGCVLNSNMVQSIKPKVTHGDALHRLFCFEYSRPNCLGTQSAPDMLSNYTSRFIKTYTDKQQPWAAFMSFIDSHEDTGVMAGMLDDPIANLLNHLQATMSTRDWNATTIALVSDHGLHYGPFFQTYQGQKERIEPILNIKPPTYLNDAAQSNLRENREKVVTAFDVHETLVEILLGSPSLAAKEHKTTTSHGSSLLQPLGPDRHACETTTDIPSRYCDFMRDHDVLEKDIALSITTPPAMSSFYADIPLTNRRKLFKTDMASEIILKPAIVVEGCRCATNVQTWFECNRHPVDDGQFTKEDLNDLHFLMVDCPQHTIQMEKLTATRPKVSTQQSVSSANNSSDANKINTKTKAKTTSGKGPFNILFIEVDSVSEEYADRTFTKTRELLQKYRIQPDLTCPNGICSADLSHRTTLAGSNSIPNQLAALAGCAVSLNGNHCSEKDFVPGRKCQHTNSRQQGLVGTSFNSKYRHGYWCPLTAATGTTRNQTAATSRYDSWIFNVAKKAGYVTLFAEEFCFEGSPYVVQDNIFPLDVDILPHKAFCRLAEKNMIDRNMTTAPSEDRWKYEKSYEPCIAGWSGYEKALISLDHVRDMWEMYPEKPKLAYLNAISAHEYTDDWSRLTLKSERYDDLLSTFLESMLDNMQERTVIIVRSDHGLQAGPLTFDYSLQVEHTRPWTEIIVPEALPGLSKKALFENQHRMTTGFDLYSILRWSIMPARDGEDKGEDDNDDDNSNNNNDHTALIPDFSYNLLRTTVPPDRTCETARAQPEFCRERSLNLDFDIKRVLT